MSQFVKKTFQMRENILVYGLGKGKIKNISDKTVRLNEKLLDYDHGNPCPVCHMIKDVGEKGACQYCLNVYCGDDDE